MIAQEFYKGTRDTMKSAKSEITQIIMALFKMEEITMGNSKAGTEFPKNKRMTEKYAED